MGAPRLTWTTWQVLAALLADPTRPQYGLEIARTAGLKSGTLYPILARLENHGWIVGETETIDPVVAGRRARRYYRLTQLGCDSAEDARAVLLSALGATSPGVIAP